MVTGKVVSIQSFGAFVELVPGIEGLVHISQLAADRRIAKPGDVVSIGQEVRSRIQNIDREQKRISLSMKAAQKEAAQTAETREIETFKTKQQEKSTAEGSAMADALRRARHGDHRAQGEQNEAGTQATAEHRTIGVAQKVDHGR